MISLTEQNLIFSDNKLIPIEDESIVTTPHSYFSPPGIALMNSLKTSQLEPTEIISSPDYNENNNRANTGYAPSGDQFNNIFNISGDE